MHTPEAEKALLDLLPNNDIDAISGTFAFFVENRIPGSEGPLIEALRCYGTGPMANHYVGSEHKRLARVGKQWLANHPSARRRPGGSLRLYAPFTIAAHFRDWNMAVIYWVRTDRSASLMPYPKMIADYRILSRDERSAAEVMMNGLLSREEFGMLTAYLKDAHHLEVREGVVPLPFPGYRIWEGKRVPWRPLALHGETDGFVHWQLDIDEGYSLPFKVSGYFRVLSPCPRIP